MNKLYWPHGICVKSPDSIQNYLKTLTYRWVLLKKITERKLFQEISSSIA